MEVQDLVVESTVEDTEVGVPALNADKLEKWEKAKMLLTTAQAELLIYFAKLEYSVSSVLGARYIVDDVDIYRTSRSPMSRFSWDKQEEFSKANPEVPHTFNQNIGNVEITIKEIKQEGGGK